MQKEIEPTVVKPFSLPPQSPGRHAIEDNTNVHLFHCHSSPRVDTPQRTALTQHWFHCHPSPRVAAPQRTTLTQHWFHCHPQPPTPAPRVVHATEDNPDAALVCMRDDHLHSSDFMQDMFHSVCIANSASHIQYQSNFPQKPYPSSPKRHIRLSSRRDSFNCLYYPLIIIGDSSNYCEPVDLVCVHPVKRFLSVHSYATAPIHLFMRKFVLERPNGG